MSSSQRRPMPLPEIENEDDMENPPAEEETSQNWLLRHLRLFLEDIDDVHLTNFIQKQDITIFRNFMMAPTTERRCLYSPSRKNLKMNSEQDEESKRKHEEELKKKQEEAQKEILQEMIQLEIQDVNLNSLPPEILFKWHDVEKIPQEDEFVYIAVRDQPKMDEKNEFDQYYIVGYLKNAERYKKLIEIAHLILREKLTFERQIDMLFMSQNLSATNREKWQNPDEAFENFITDSLCFAFWLSKKQELPTDDIDVESIEALLRPRLKNFVANPSQQNLTQLWLEMSLYEIKFLNGPQFVDTIQSRLQRIYTIFSALQLLYSGLNKDWLQKTIFYTVELISRIFATKIKENAKKLLAVKDDERENIEEGEGENFSEIKPIFLEFLKLGSSIFDERSEEHACLEKIRQCMRIIDFIEEELEKIQKLVSDLNDPKRDMMLDRSGMDKSFEIVQEIWNVFEESYFESSLETGNFESLKNVCLQLSTLHNKLKETIPPLDEYCT
uniref:Uncharacterized protein n=1 Tax=Acrobeloides nanus TaxID=290746 RepID=A0A914E8T8_9BILA